MRSVFLGSALFGACLVYSTSVGPTAECIQERQVPKGSDRYIVLFHSPENGPAVATPDSADRSEVKRYLMGVAMRSQSSLLMERATLFAGRSLESNWLANALIFEMSPQEAREIEARPEVKQVFKDPRIRLDPIVASQVSTSAPGDSEESTWGLKAMGVLQARENHAVDGSGVVVGLLDTGFEETHPALQGKLLAWKDVVDNKQGPAYDDNGHGTHCAGTIAGSAGANGMEIGVAPGAKFVAGKIFNKHGYTSGSVILAGMQWVVDPDGKPGTGDEPRLVSNSWGSNGVTEVFLSAVESWKRLGILPVFAAGNAGPRAGTVGSPGAYPDAFTVGASTVDTQIASFSSRGPVVWRGKRIIKPDVVAPGRDVTSAFPGGGYRSLSGTSMATPHVAGLAALLYQKKPDLDLEDIRYVLEETAVQHGEGEKNSDWGRGLVDADAALNLVSK